MPPNEARLLFRLRLADTDEETGLPSLGSQDAARDALGARLDDIFANLAGKVGDGGDVSTETVAFEPVTTREKVRRRDLEPRDECWCRDAWQDKAECFRFEDTPTGYTASSTFAVRVTGGPAGGDLAPGTVAAAADAVLDRGGDDVALLELSFAVSEGRLRAAELEVAVRALGQARGKAEAFAAAAGGEVEAPLLIQETPIDDPDVEGPVALRPPEPEAPAAASRRRDAAPALALAAAEPDPAAGLTVAPKPVELWKAMYAMFSVC